MSIISRSSRIFAISIALLILSSGAAAAVTITNGYHTPDPAPGERVNNQIIGFTAQNISAEGNTDWFYVNIEDEIAKNASVNQASVEGASISSSAEYVKWKDDPTIDTVRFAVSSDAAKPVNLNVSVDLDIKYPNKTSQYKVNVTIDDSKSKKTSKIATEIKVGDPDQKVEEIMSPEFLQINTETSIDIIKEILREDPTVLVKEKETGQIKGIITKSDLI